MPEIFNSLFSASVNLRSCLLSFQLRGDGAGVLRSSVRPGLLHPLHRHPQLVQMHQTQVRTHHHLLLYIIYYLSHISPGAWRTKDQGLKAACVTYVGHFSDNGFKDASIIQHCTKSRLKTNLLPPEQKGELDLFLKKKANLS